MSPRLSRITQAISGLALILLIAVPHCALLAKEDLNCSAYAATAAAQNDQNVMQQCGFTGPRWSSDHSAHFKWCETVTMADLTAEDNARRSMLAQCAEKPKQNQQACQTYAKAAVEHQLANKSQGCGFSGGAWSENYAAHFDWCLKAAPDGALRKETRVTSSFLGVLRHRSLRGKMPARPTRRPPSPSRRRTRRGDASSPAGLGSANWAEHFAWCETVKQNESDKETAVRVAALRDQVPEESVSLDKTLYRLSDLYLHNHGEVQECAALTRNGLHFWTCQWLHNSP